MIAICSAQLVKIQVERSLKRKKEEEERIAKEEEERLKKDEEVKEDKEQDGDDGKDHSEEVADKEEGKENDEVGSIFNFRSLEKSPVQITTHF